ncbi:acyl-CoA thioesterase [Jhaorihella thermophila]|uniref:Acyl-CoA thioesterase FadM n=1 Tax=Jhaorihella thermophila TaxID=488547 RepID=A0A1H5SB60_9RHOB|nr:thioesterase family protein [Jhaorihella thermophila]SEF47745.1 Acyl-CoA thioesterase FadM [Jhaorihella thermophila]
MQPMRFIVGSRDCDELGHLNVSGYIYYCNRAGSAFMRDIGWPPGQGNGGRRYSFAAVHVVSDYLAEVREGQAILVRAGVAKIGGKSVTFDNRITLEDGTPVFRSLWKSALMDLDTRRAVEVPDDLRSALEVGLVARYWGK